MPKVQHKTWCTMCHDLDGDQQYKCKQFDEVE